jgi:hypothetical protein
VPLLLHAPGVAPTVVTRLTSHLDLTPTVLGLMGVKTPPEEYGSGFDLLGPAVRTDTIVSAYDDLALRGKDATVVLPSGGTSVTRVTVLDRDDRPLPPAESEAALRAAAPRLRELFRELGRFRK